MHRHRIWIEIVLLGTAIAFALAVLLATLGAAAGAAERSAAAGARETSAEVTQSEATQDIVVGAQQSFEGMVTCSRCGAKHQPSLDRSATTCVRVCVHGGANFALVRDGSTLLLEGDLSSLKKLAGQRARVMGVRNGDTIKVASIAAVI